MPKERRKDIVVHCSFWLVPSWERASNKESLFSFSRAFSLHLLVIQLGPFQYVVLKRVLPEVFIRDLQFSCRPNLGPDKWCEEAGQKLASSDLRAKKRGVKASWATRGQVHQDMYYCRIGQLGMQTSH